MESAEFRLRFLCGACGAFEFVDGCILVLGRRGRRPYGRGRTSPRPGVLSNRRLMQLHWRAVEKINAQGLSIGRIQTSGPFCAIDLCTPMEYNLVMTFVETKLFTSRILDAMSDDEYAALQHYLANRPDAGAVIPGAGGVRKVRWSGSGRGKRGGSRLIYYWDCGDRILMLYVYLKNERENLTEEQKKLMRQIAEGYKHE